MIKAYFIGGGPDDLVLRHLPDDYRLPRLWRVAERPAMGAFNLPDVDLPTTEELRIYHYRLLFTQTDMAVYLYEERYSEPRTKSWRKIK